ncbi:hypothetical protein FRC10_008630 [Ceratobasidium sp. 414]|nr:hypothetical protein FRC10_008630 [Ceratobasidium sp. 414]
MQDHIEAFVNIAGTLLPKAMAAFISGEMRDTVEINPAGAYVIPRQSVLEKVNLLNRQTSILLRSWVGSASMWIKGGDAVWGTPMPSPLDSDPSNHTPPHFVGAPDDPPDVEPEHSHARFFNFRSAPPAPHAQSGPGIPGNLSAAQAGDWVLTNVEDRWQRMMAQNYSYGIERDEEQLKKNNDDHTKFSNPLEVQLPNAPRSYWYAASEYEPEGSAKPLPGDECTLDSESNVTCVAQQTPLNFPFARRNFIDIAVHNETGTPKE